MVSPGGVDSFRGVTPVQQPCHHTRGKYRIGMREVVPIDIIIDGAVADTFQAIVTPFAGFLLMKGGDGW